MQKIEIEKNRLDLAYHHQLQILNAVLILGTTGILSFIATYIWKPELIVRGIELTGVVLVFCTLSYRRIESRLQKISEELQRLT